MRSLALRSVLIGVISANMIFAPHIFAQPGTTIPVPPGGEDLDPTRPHPAPPPPASIDPQVTIPAVFSSLFGLTPSSLQQYAITSTSAGPNNFSLTILDGTGASVATGTFAAIARTDIENVSEALTAATEDACAELAVTRPAPTIGFFVVAGSMSSGTQSKIVNAIGMTFLLDAAYGVPSAFTILLPFAIQTNAPAALAENARAALDLTKLGEQVAARGQEGPCDFSSPAYVNATPAGKCAYTKACAYGRAWRSYDLHMAEAMVVVAAATAACAASVIFTPFCLLGGGGTFGLTALVLRKDLSDARTAADQDYCKCLIDSGLACTNSSGVAEQ